MSVSHGRRVALALRRLNENLRRRGTRLHGALRPGTQLVKLGQDCNADGCGRSISAVTSFELAVTLAAPPWQDLAFHLFPWPEFQRPFEL